MRILVTLAALLLGVANANAADIVGYSRHVRGYHARQISLYAWEPGVIIRTYWRKPWRNRHYFPTTGEKPEEGRLEDMSVRDRPEPAEDFCRTWTTTSVFADEEPRPRLMPAQDPRAEELPQLPQSQAPQTIRP
jgi:hypothetical protein